MSDHPGTVEGALKWARVEAECYGDDEPDMSSVALQTLAAEIAALRARVRELVVVLQDVEKEMGAAAGWHPADWMARLVLRARRAIEEARG